jgi:hypothetical protein
VVIKSSNDPFLSAISAKFPWVRPSATTRNATRTREHLPIALANIASRGGVLHPRFVGRDLRRRGHFERRLITNDMDAPEGKERASAISARKCAEGGLELQLSQRIAVPLCPLPPVMNDSFPVAFVGMAASDGTSWEA